MEKSYCFFWIFKQLIFPDSFPVRVNIIVATFIYLSQCLYVYPGYLIISGQANNNPSNERIGGAMLMYIMGLFFMVASDCHKYFTLKIKKGLISNGLFASSRNPNYFGEVLAFSSFCFLVGEWGPWLVYSFIWITHFRDNMNRKDKSLAQKEGWEEYRKSSWMFFHKIAGCNVVTFLTYLNITIFIIACQLSGGFEMLVKNVHYIYHQEVLPFLNP